MQEGALAHLRIVDLTDERGIYAGKLLADLGANIIRPEPPDGDLLRQRGPHHQSIDPSQSSLYYAFFASNRKSFVVDSTIPEHTAQLRALLELADVVLICDGHWSSQLIDLSELSATLPQQVQVNVSSFGPAGPWKDFLAPDLIAGALGGALATTGDVNTSPLKSFGELNFMVSGVYAAIAALAAIYTKDTQEIGQTVEVSVHECIASCLEHVFMFYWYHEILERPQEQVLARRGSTHWSNAFTVMNGQDGSIMITPTPDFDKQLAWLIEEDAFGDLLEPQYQDPDNMALLIVRTMELLEQWVAGKDVESLFHQAQARHIPYGWVQPLARVGENPQLQGRNWFVSQKLGDVDLKMPGAPYHLSTTPWRMGDARGVGADTASVLADIGWSGADE